MPDEANILVTYAAVTVAASTQAALAANFLEFLVGPEAQGGSASYRFVPVILMPTESLTS